MVLGFKFLVWLFTAGTDDAQILKKCQPVGYLESDDDESDYFADDEMSPCSSPSHNNMCDSENEDHSQKFMGMCSLCLVDLSFVFCNVCAVEFFGSVSSCEILMLRLLIFV